MAKKTERNKIRKIDNLRNSILKLVKGNFDYFRDRPKHLAWAMMNFRLIDYVGRKFWSNSNNQEDLVLKAAKSLKKPEDSWLMYSAWDVSKHIYNKDFFDVNPNLPLEAKKNKTVEEWIALETDKRYRYQDLTPDARAVENELLCRGGPGNGYKWTKSGSIVNIYFLDGLAHLYGGFTRVQGKIRPDIKDKILGIRSNALIAKDVKNNLKKSRRVSRINNSENEAEKQILRYESEIKPLINNLPKNEQKTAMKVFRDVAYLEAIVEEAEKWSDEEWEEATKSNVFNYHGKRFDVSDVRIDSLKYLHRFQFRLKDRIKIGDNINYKKNPYSFERSTSWCDFVYKIKKPDNLKTKKALGIVEKFNIKTSKERLRAKLKGLKGPEETPEVKKAKAYLNIQRPNLKKYKPVLEKAKKGDEKSIKLLDKLSGVPSNGWNVIKSFIDYDKRLDGEARVMYLKKSNSGIYSDLSDHSNLVTMPDNAHSSYVEAGIRVSDIILSDEKGSRTSKKYARQFLEKWQKNYQLKKCVE